MALLPTSPLDAAARLANVGAGLVLANGVVGRLSPFDDAAWELISDEIGLKVTAPYEIRQVAIDEGVRTTTFGGLTDASLNSAPVPNEPRALSVGCEFRAEHFGVDITPIHLDLVRMQNFDARLGRRPLVRLRWKHIEVEGWLSAASVNFIDGSFQGTGFPRAFTVAITVSQAGPRELERTSRFNRETKQRRIGHGETFESLAQEEYGDPDDGILVRRYNPQVSLDGEQPGDVIRLLDSSHPKMRDTREPVSPALGGDVSVVLQRFAERRLGVSGPGFLALETELGL